MNTVQISKLKQLKSEKKTITCSSCTVGGCGVSSVLGRFPTYIQRKLDEMVVSMQIFDINMTEKSNGGRLVVDREVRENIIAIRNKVLELQEHSNVFPDLNGAIAEAINLHGNQVLKQVFLG